MTLCLCKRRVEVAGARVGVRPAQHAASRVICVAVVRMSGRALESIVEERVESGWNVGVAAFWAADPAGRSADAAVFCAKWRSQSGSTAKSSSGGLGRSM
jgi:hypothetical protein